MASNSQTSLKSAADALNNALANLEAAVDAAGKLKAATVATSVDDGRLRSLEAALTAAQAENTFLLEDNKRLSAQLKQLQQEHLELQDTAESTLTRLNASVSQLDMILEH